MDAFTLKLGRKIYFFCFLLDCIDDRQRKIKRGELAVLIYGVLHPFEKKQVDVEGRFVR